MYDPIVASPNKLHGKRVFRGSTSKLAVLTADPLLPSS